MVVCFLLFLREREGKGEEREIPLLFHLVMYLCIRGLILVRALTAIETSAPGRHSNPLS